MLHLLNHFNSFVGFIPHGHCYLWKPSLVWLHIISDGALALAYYSIPPSLLYFVRKRQDLPFPWIFLLFGAFIVACGTTHLMEIWTLWHPTYWLSGALKAVTAVISLYTIACLLPLLPQVLALPSPAQLEAVNQRLEREIIDHQRVQEALRCSHAVVKAQQEASLDGILVMDADGQVASYNQTFCQVWQIPQAALATSTSNQILQLVCDRLLSPDNYLAEMEELCHSPQTAKRSELVLKDGRVLDQYTKTAQSPDGKYYSRVWFFRDITEQKRAEMTWKSLVAGTSAVVGADFFPALARHLASALDVSYVIVSEVKDGQSQSIAFCAHHKLQPNFVLPIAGIPCERTLEQGDYCCQNQLQRHFPAAPVLLEMQAESYFGVALVDSRGQTIGTLCILDVKPLVDAPRAEALLRIFAARAATELERQKAEQALAQLNQELEGRVRKRTVELTIANEKLHKEVLERQQTEAALQNLTVQLQRQNEQLTEVSHLKSEFLTNVSHELRTPLTSVLGMSSLLLKQHFGTLNSKQAQYLSLIHASGEHLLSLINDLLDLAKIEAGKLDLNIEIVDLVELCQTALKMIGVRALAKHQHLELEEPIACKTITVDRQRVLQVLLNYLSNAVKFTPEGGKITLSTRLASNLEQLEHQGVETCGSSRTPAFVVLSVTDTGIGVPPEKQHLLFQQFQQVDGATNRQHDGSGLGLSLTKRLIELHNGRVSFTSTPGIGSTFSAWLPLPEMHDRPSVEMTVDQLDGSCLLQTNQAGAI